MKKLWLALVAGVVGIGLMAGPSIADSTSNQAPTARSTQPSVPSGAKSATDLRLADTAKQSTTAKPITPLDRCNYTTARPLIQRGSTGAAVKQAQCYLNYSLSSSALWPRLVEDGIFGPKTDSATRTFQRCAGIGIDGKIGPITWEKLTYWANSPDYVC